MRSETKTNLNVLSLSEIKTFLKQQKKAHFYRKVQFVQYKKEGFTHDEISKRLNVCLKTLTDWNNLFSTRGMEGLIDVSYARRVSKLCAVENEIKKKATQGEIPTISACKEWLRKERGISTCFSNVGRFLKKNGIVLQKNEASTRRYA